MVPDDRQPDVDAVLLDAFAAALLEVAAVLATSKVLEAVEAVVVVAVVEAPVAVFFFAAVSSWSASIAVVAAARAGNIVYLLLEPSEREFP
jgi:hypothetical protein